MGTFVYHAKNAGVSWSVVLHQRRKHQSVSQKPTV